MCNKYSLSTDKVTDLIYEDEHRRTQKDLLLEIEFRTLILKMELFKLELGYFEEYPEVGFNSLLLQKIISNFRNNLDIAIDDLNELIN